MTIIPFEKKHLDEIVKLENECFSIPWSEDMFEEELNSNIAEYYVAVSEEKVVGYAGMWRILDEGHITNIAVSPAFRRRRIGQALLEKLISSAKEEGISVLLLEVRKSNEAAITLYAGNGFKKVGLRKGYYSDTNEDAVLMDLKL